MDFDLAPSTSPAASGTSRRAAGGTEDRPLAPGTARTLRLAPGASVRVLAGRVWLTEPGDADDHVLAAGQQHVVARGGRVVVECDSATAARLRIDVR